MLQAAAWQDSLLQAYRALHLTFQSLLMAIGIGLCIALLSLAHEKALEVSGLFYLLAWFHILSSGALERLVIDRGRDINYWHTLIVEAEHKLPIKKRFFTLFKVKQKQKRFRQRSGAYQPDLLARYLSDDPLDEGAVEELIGKGLGHTRRVVDEYMFRGVSLVWLIIAVGAALNIAPGQTPTVRYVIGILLAIYVFGEVILCWPKAPAV